MSANHAPALARTHREKYSKETRHAKNIAYGQNTYDRNDRPYKKRRDDPTFDSTSGDFGRLRSLIRWCKGEEGSHFPLDTPFRQEYSLDEEEHLREDGDCYRENFQIVQQKADQYEKKNRELQDDLNQERVRVQQAILAIDHMEANMNNREYFLGDQASNEDVRAMFMILMIEIKTWSQAFSNGNARTLREENFQVYQKVTPIYTALEDLENSTENSKQKRFFVRGWIGYVMCTRLFRNLEEPIKDLATDAWLEKPLEDSFLLLENRLLRAGWFPYHLCAGSTDRDRSRGVPYKSFNDWRALTAELLRKSVNIKNGRPVDETPTLVELAVSEVMEVIRPWHRGGTPETLKFDEGTLHVIFTHAMQLSSVIRRQRALWSVRFPWALGRDKADLPLRFDPASMDDERNNDVDMKPLKMLCVEFIVTPALYKRGNMNGERFDKEEAMCRAAVVIAGLD